MKPVILVAIHGFVFYGLLDEPADYGAAAFHLHSAAVIRKWGTDAGLGQLALCGKQPETVLDPCGEVIIPRHAVVSVIPCREPL